MEAYNFDLGCTSGRNSVQHNFMAGEGILYCLLLESACPSHDDVEAAALLFNDVLVGFVYCHEPLEFSVVSAYGKHVVSIKNTRSLRNIKTHY